MKPEGLEELYQSIIIDHYKHPRCQTKCTSPTATASKYNPLCGDSLQLELQVQNQILADICFHGKGCAISQASASIMSELCKGRKLEEVQKLCQQFNRMLCSTLQAEQNYPELGDAGVFISLKSFPARYRCALLAWEAMQECLMQVNNE